MKRRQPTASPARRAAALGTAIGAMLLAGSALAVDYPVTSQQRSTAKQVAQTSLPVLVKGVVRPDGTHWQIANLSVHDGSIFPTSIGANPQLSIYGIVNRLASGLAKRLSGRAVVLA